MSLPRRRDPRLAQLEALFSQAPAGVAIWEGPDHVYSFINERYARMFPRGNLLGLTLREAFPESADETLAIWDHVYRTGEPFVAYEHRVELDRRGTGLAGRASDLRDVGAVRKRR